MPYFVELVLKGQCHSWAWASKHQHYEIFRSSAILDFELHVNISLETCQNGLEYPCLVIHQVPSCYMLNKQTSIDGKF